MRQVLCVATLAALLLAGCQQASFEERFASTPVMTTATGPALRVGQSYHVGGEAARNLPDGVYCSWQGRLYVLRDSQWVPCGAGGEPCVDGKP